MTEKLELGGKPVGESLRRARPYTRTDRRTRGKHYADGGPFDGRRNIIIL